MSAEFLEFYKNWSIKQLEDVDRTRILKWKAVNLVNLFLRTVKSERLDSICEIGGAEGIVLANIGSILSATKLVNYDISNAFCQYGASLYPEIEFRNEEFSLRQEELYDLVVCSDIIEHVEEEDKFLHTVSESCRYVLMKIPVEECIMNSSLPYWLHGKRKPENYKYGIHHYNGHLRGYTVQKAIKAVASHFTIVDLHISHVAHFYGGPKQRWIGKYLGERFTTWMFGGAVFILGISKIRC